jgi:hypothetical protein
MSISRYRLLLSVLVLVAFLLPGERGDFGRLPRIRHVAPLGWRRSASLVHGGLNA